MKKDCPMCPKGILHRKAVEVERYGVGIGRFAAEVCSSCGEEIFGSHEAAKIESRMKALGVWGAERASVYRLGNNFAIGIRKRIAQLLGLNKDSKVSLIPQAGAKRIIVEIN
ncbi:MAG: hypothetical protein AABX01_05570 [Candidatus Micrarchaeota archaeon]